MLQALALLTVLASAAQGEPEDADFWRRNRLLGDPGSIHSSLGEAGVSLVPAWTGEVLSNVSGGLQRRTIFASLLDLVIDTDLEKAAGWTGGHIRLNPFWIAGGGLTDQAVGDLARVSNIDAQDEVRLFEAWFQQSLFDEALSVRVGILAADQEFAITSNGLLFLNSAFGAPPIISANVPVSVYPLGAAGLRVRTQIGEDFYLQGEVYDGNPGTETSNRSGLRIQLKPGEGFLLLAEAGWNFETPLPGTFKAGAFFHTGPFELFRSGIFGRGLGGGYLLFEQQLLREEVEEEGLSLVSHSFKCLILRAVRLSPGEDEGRQGRRWDAAGPLDAALRIQLLRREPARPGQSADPPGRRRRRDDPQRPPPRQPQGHASMQRLHGDAGADGHSGPEVRRQLGRDGARRMSSGRRRR